MSKRNAKPGDTGGDGDLALERLRRHLQFLGLTHTLNELDDRLAWAVRERPGPTALLEHILGAEAAHKLQQRIGRRIDRSGLKEHKTLEAFDFDFQPKLDKSVVLELARLDFVRTAAILDRLAMHALRIDIDGPSYRQHVAHERATGRGAKRTERERAPRHEADGD